MTLPTPDQIRSRQTAYLATEHWWRSRVEKMVEVWSRQARVTRHQTDYQQGYDDALLAVAATLEALIAERNPL